MARDMFESDPASRALLEQADAILGVPLTRICFEGPDEVLRQTENTQPAIFLHSVALFRAMGGPPPAMVAGHSLGEYSALVAAGALEFEDALRLVRLRGTLMQRAGEEQKGTMAAIVGPDPAAVQEMCREASAEGIVQPANFNSPGQIVISGSVAGVRKAMALAQAKGARMVKELVVSGAFHSPLMESARDGLQAALRKTAIRDAGIPVYANVTAEPVTRADDIRDLLARQLTSPVRWEQTMLNMARDGAGEFVEIGPGKVLQGLLRRTLPAANGRGIDKWTDLRS
jgi:[acyl-carrier-protein] S-malonyltransferase